MSSDNRDDRDFHEPGDYASGPPRQRAERERLSQDYGEEGPVRRRPAVGGRASSGGGLASLLGNDPATRKLVGGAVGIGAVLLLAVGGWSLMGGHQGGIPLIGPPPGPVRDLPADPGGIQIMGGEGAETDMTGQGEAHLAPGPEKPDAEAMARQYGVQPGVQGGGASAPPAVPPAEAPKTGADVAAPSVVPVPVPSGDGAPAKEEASAPERTQAPAAASSEPKAVVKPEKKVQKEEKAPARGEVKPVQKPLPAPEPLPEASAGHAEVQLAALDSEASAQKEWETLRHQAPALFAGHSPLFEKTQVGTRTFVRLRVGGFADLKAARAYCVKLHAQSVACTPARF